MKEHSKKPPIDDLFARKLGNASLTPSRDGFERLQARMKGAGAGEPKLVFWPNPVAQRSMAIAACLLVVFLFGWLYWGSDKQTPDETTVAYTQKPESGRQAGRKPRLSLAPPATQAIVTHEPVSPQGGDRPTDEEKIAFEKQPVQRVYRESGRDTKRIVVPTPATSIAVTEPINPADKKINGQTAEAAPVSPDKSALPERIADNVTKSTPVAERVLVVTIAEPESLVAARQAAKESVAAKPLVSSKPEKETRVGSLWQQVKRLKQGEVFARQDDNSDERGLLGRAYEGIRQSLDKEKPAKQ